MSKKRAREAPNVNISLIEVYEDLVHEDEAIRLKAAHSLLTKHLPKASHEQSTTILKRLLRGLCSGRKAARLGFSVALTECLSQLQEREGSISSSEVLDVLENSTIPESGTSGQDERDHYFGRLFGSDAIIKSNILFTKAEQLQWLRLLDIVCGISAKKPWMRQECGWILYNCVQRLAQLENKQHFIVSIAEKLVQHKLIRTPEGLAIWIAIQHHVDKSKLPKSVWRYDSPLAKKDLQTLAQVLKDAKGDAKDEADFESQGSAMWSARLHFVWEVVLAELFDKTAAGNIVDFGEFWQIAVDDGLFAPSNSPERKHWGLQLLQKAISSAPKENLSKCFSKNITSCLLLSLKADDRYLQKGAQKVLRSVQTRAKNDAASVKYLIAALLQTTNYIDFDTTTKTKTIETILTLDSQDAIEGVVDVLKELFYQPNTPEESAASSARTRIVNCQTKLLNHAAVNHDLKIPRRILTDWISMLEVEDMSIMVSPALIQPTKVFIRQRLAAAFEQILKLGSEGRLLTLDCIGLVRMWNLSADQEILQVLETGWTKFKSHHKIAHRYARKGQTSKDADAKAPRSSSSDTGAEGAEGMALLYGLIIFQVYNDEPEAVSILEELIAFEEHTAQATTANGFEIDNADGLVDILLSFASKPSKFLRRVTLDIFETFASKLTREGLAALVNVLQTKETKAGQAELFEAEGELAEADGSESVSDASDVEMLDSNVELANVKDAYTDDSTSSGSNSDSDSDTESSSSDAEADEELVALEESLADALGTRKLTTDDVGGDDDDSSSDSDSDMDDDQMLGLDEKLSEVFRTRAAAQSQSKSKQKESKAAKENITNFKNRVLDMIDVYLKHETRNGTALSLLLPLLRLARETAVKQLAMRAIDLVKAFCNRYKGLQNLPVLNHANGAIVKAKKSTIAKTRNHRDDQRNIPADHDDDDESERAMEIMLSIHDEVCLSSSNAHKSACSQASILLAKTLTKNGVSIDAVVNVYAQTQVRMVTDEKATVQEVFFRDWIGWCGTVRGKLG